MIEDHPNWTHCLTAIQSGDSPGLRRYRHKQFSCCGLEVQNDSDGAVVKWKVTPHPNVTEMPESQLANNEGDALSAADAWVRSQAHPA